MRAIAIAVFGLPLIAPVATAVDYLCAFEKTFSYDSKSGCHTGTHIPDPIHVRVENQQISKRFCPKQKCDGDLVVGDGHVSPVGLIEFRDPGTIYTIDTSLEFSQATLLPVYAELAFGACPTLEE
jgi:hypothetical protein